MSISSCTLAQIHATIASKPEGMPLLEVELFEVELLEVELLVLTLLPTQTNYCIAKVVFNVTKPVDEKNELNQLVVSVRIFEEAPKEKST